VDESAAQSSRWRRSEADGDRAAVAVVAGAGDELDVGRGEDAAVELGGVVGLDEGLAAVVQAAVAEQEAGAAEREVAAVVVGQAVRDRGDAELVAGAAPGRAAQVGAGRDGVVDLGVRERLVAGPRSSPRGGSRGAGWTARARR